MTFARRTAVAALCLASLTPLAALMGLNWAYYLGEINFLLGQPFVLDTLQLFGGNRLDFRHDQMRPLLLETNFQNPVLAPFAWLLNAIRMPDLEKASAMASFSCGSMLQVA